MNTQSIPVITPTLLAKLKEQAAVRRAEILNTPNMEIPVGSTVYYLSPHGNDENDGTTPQTAWKTIARLKAEALPYGSYVCFERGGLWRGKFDACCGVTYTAYGEGPKPELRGSPYDGAIDGAWEEVAKNIWRYSKKFFDDVGMIVMNHGEENGIKMLMDYTEAQAKEVVSQRMWNGYESLEKNTEFVHDFGDRWTQRTHPDGGYVYLYSDKGNPAKVWNSIEFIHLGSIICIRKRDDVTVDNLCLRYSNFAISSGKDNLRIQNCEIGWIGGCVHGYSATGRAWRYGNGIEIYGGCLNFVCHNNWIYQCYDAGVTPQRRGGDMDIIMDGMHFTNNLFEKCVYSIEYFLGAPDEGDSPIRYMANFHIKNNYFMDAGGFGEQRPDATSIAHIKGWDHMNPLNGDFTIEDNVFVGSAKMMIHIGYAKECDSPLFRGNIFAQYKDGQWGRNGVNPTALQMYTSQTVSAGEYKENEFYVIE